MNEVVPADRKEIAIPAEHHHIELWISQFHTGGKGDGPAVRRVIGIQPSVTSPAARASDTGHHDRFIQIDAAGLHGHHAGGKRRTDPASRAPDVGNAVCSQHRIQRMIGPDFIFFHFHSHLHLEQLPGT